MLFLALFCRPLRIFHVYNHLYLRTSLWCWEGLGAGGEGDDRGWDGWMASLTRWTWIWVNSGSWWWTGRPGMLWFMGSQRVRHNWATELNWRTSHFFFSNLYVFCFFFLPYFSGQDLQNLLNIGDESRCFCPISYLK